MVMTIAENHRLVFCALATSLYPPPVLCKRRAASLDAPVRRRFGCGAAQSPVCSATAKPVCCWDTGQ